MPGLAVTTAAKSGRTLAQLLFLSKASANLITVLRISLDHNLICSFFHTQLACQYCGKGAISRQQGFVLPATSRDSPNYHVTKALVT
ncbi:hypothetical protein METBIDRAFT_146276 [Metschnikowia bicuspidata var. bicuspidata NRRL YB-4993]|uniref:Uncharacterized protein n=1 Tax=Metschnikowia bicuspidata var. bicuspidata NRRL YB-4993 TaxID=869754 RepID=A0A1A0HDW3_9ASCO|nr:hypothetical protein METBIDRAFT_146276 [Metschnikowia bicuspidata var. bicuspidata NRRL YB-4993]OBA22087.1 hypothetical protein METBIDRAFT_146276 [Metschnikowia bicuspidata var. bicuspidata NRRL YB-4993]